MIQYGKQSIEASDIEAVLSVLQSDRLTQGEAIPAFEAALCAYTGAQDAVAVSHGTAALHLACLVLGVGTGDLVWTSANTFAASANCARYCGADVDFVDIDLRTGNLSVQALREKLSRAAASGRLPKVIIPVHFAGQPCDMLEISALVRPYGIKIIEDAAHALGAEYAGAKIGKNRYADLTVFSFHPVKSITTGEGGAILTEDAAWAARLRALRSHGITRDPTLMSTTNEGAWYYEQIELGYNYRMTDIQAALGASQMKRLDQFIARRESLAERYRALMGSLNLKPLSRYGNRRSAWHLYVIRVSKESRRRVFDALRAAHIEAHVHYIPVHLHPDYRERGFKVGDFPQAETYYQEALTLPLHPTLSEDAQDRVLSTLKAAL